MKIWLTRESIEEHKAKHEAIFKFFAGTACKNCNPARFYAAKAPYVLSLMERTKNGEHKN